MKKIMILIFMVMSPVASMTGCSNNTRQVDDLKDKISTEEESSILPLEGENYFGLSVPKDIAEIFAPDFISMPDRLVGKVVVAPNGKRIYYQMYTPSYQSTIYYTEVIDGAWTVPKETPFAKDENILLSSISPDGNWIYVHQNGKGSNIYKIAVTETGWGELELLESPINTEGSDAWYQVQENGVGYLSSSREGSVGKDIWEIKVLANSTIEATNIGEIVNSENWDFSPCIAPDGSYMIFGSDRLGRRGLARLYITFRTESGDWTAPVSLNVTGAYINDDAANQSNPFISSDGEHLFFMRHYDMTKMSVYWIGTSFIDDIRDMVLSD